MVVVVVVVVVEEEEEEEEDDEGAEEAPCCTNSLDALLFRLPFEEGLGVEEGGCGEWRASGVCTRERMPVMDGGWLDRFTGLIAPGPDRPVREPSISDEVKVVVLEWVCTLLLADCMLADSSSRKKDAMPDRLLADEQLSRLLLALRR